MTPSAQTAGGRRVTRWTRELIIEKILEWHARYGEAPCSADWNPSLARWRAQEWRTERYRDGVWPSTNAVKRPFGGSFDAAVRAAGLEPHRPGPRRSAGAARPAVDQRGPYVPSGAVIAVADAEARVRAADDQAQAAARDAAEARRAAAAAEARLRELQALVAGEPRRLSSNELAELRGRGPSGPAVLADALRRLARARTSGDRAGVAAALGEVAAAAVGWRDRI
jgi:hypothetical protein